jgi:tRNA (guanine-N7-)-methyltransferase
MGHKKLIRFAAIREFSNVLEYPERMPGRWQQFFGNSNPLVLELACGRGEYTLGLASMYPDVNFLGVDIKGNRLYNGAKKALEERLTNAAFLRIQIDKLMAFFAPGEVQAIWITFPDPQLRTSKARKRLTHPKFLRIYQQLLVAGGVIHLKTDSPDLYRFTKTVLDAYSMLPDEDTDDLYRGANLPPVLQIRTHYESLDIAGSNRVHYLQFRLPASPLPDIDKTLQEQLKVYEAGTEGGR